MSVPASSYGPLSVPGCQRQHAVWLLPCCQKACHEPKPAILNRLRRCSYTTALVYRSTGCNNSACVVCDWKDPKSNPHHTAAAAAQALSYLHIQWRPQFISRYQLTRSPTAPGLDEPWASLNRSWSSNPKGEQELLLLRRGKGLYLSLLACDAIVQPFVQFQTAAEICVGDSKELAVTSIAGLHGLATAWRLMAAGWRQMEAV